jgi:MFS family permease
MNAPETGKPQSPAPLPPNDANQQPSSEATKPRARKPLSPTYRWVVLAMMSLICFAQYYIFDAITPIGTLMKEPIAAGGLGFSSSDYGLVVSAYSVANVFLLLVVVGGVLVDKLGLKASGILYGLLCFGGAALIALGAWRGLPGLLGGGYGWLHTAFLSTWTPELKIMILGRAIFGAGAESILVVNNKVLARWFKGKELGFAYGLNLTIMRLGTFLALNLQAPAADWFGLRGSLWFAAGIMGVGFATFFIYLWMEAAARGRAGAPGVNDGTGIAPEEKFVLREAFSFDLPFWFITLLCVTFYAAVFPFQSYAPDILVQRFGYSPDASGHIASALIFGTMIFTPILGLVVDRKGKRATLMVVGALLLVPCHLLIGYTHLWPMLPIFFVGVALSLVPAALWAAIPMMVPESRLGTAFGVVGYVQNVGLMVFPYVAGLIADKHTVTAPDGSLIVDYASTMLMFASLGLVGFVFALLLKWTDGRRKSGMSIEAVMLR